MTRFNKLLLTAVTSTVLTGLASAAPAALARPFYYFAFGDSYTEIGFQTNGEQPSEKNPLGNPASGNSTTFAGGANYVGYLTRKYNSTLVYTYDFGFGGATISKSLVPTASGIHSFEEQVQQYFKPNYAPASGQKFWTGDTSIFSIFFGINDIGGSTTGKTPYTGDRNARITQLLDKYFSLCAELYQSGARRFLFIGIPPLDRSPLLNKPGYNATQRQQYSDWVNIYNGQLATRAPDFVRNNTGSVAAVYDYHRYFRGVLDNPQASGFPDATCVNADGTTCIWHDDYHVGTRLNDYLADRMKVAMNSLGFNGSTPTGGYNW